MFTSPGHRPRWDTCRPSAGNAVRFPWVISVTVAARPDTEDETKIVFAATGRAQTTFTNQEKIVSTLFRLLWKYQILFCFLDLVYFFHAELNKLPSASSRLRPAAPCMWVPPLEAILCHLTPIPSSGPISRRLPPLVWRAWQWQPLSTNCNTVHDTTDNRRSVQVRSSSVHTSLCTLATQNKSQTAARLVFFASRLRLPDVE
jgi:hypothetical protein